MQSILAESAAGRLRFVALAVTLAATLASFAVVRAHHHHHHHGHRYAPLGRCADVALDQAIAAADRMSPEEVNAMLDRKAAALARPSSVPILVVHPE